MSLTALRLRIERPLGEKFHGFVVADFRAVHFVIKNRVGHSAQVELELRETQRQSRSP